MAIGIARMRMKIMHLNATTSNVTMREQVAHSTTVYYTSKAVEVQISSTDKLSGLESSVASALKLS